MGNILHHYLNLMRPNLPSFRRLSQVVKALPAILCGLLVVPLISCKEPPPPNFTEVVSGVGYAHDIVASVPWSIHVVRVDRSNPNFGIQSIHAEGGALGLNTLSQQLKHLPDGIGTPLAAVNGDFYQRERAYAGDPRGLQIMNGELLSAPQGGVAFWLDARGQPQATNITPHFQVTWPDGNATEFGLNEERPPGAAVLFTPAIGPSTHTTGGRELILGPPGAGPWLPLRLNANFTARVLEVREAGDTKSAAGNMVLSLGPVLARTLPKLEAGALLKLSTATIPMLEDVAVAISGGPVLIREGKRSKIRKAKSEAYQFSSMFERHPRTAIGWNQRYFYLIEVDGRQANLSAGMTLDELAAYLIRLGCDGAMNLDGGGSATLWCNGQVRNSPCDGKERPIANSLVVVRVARSSSSPAATP